MKMRISSLPKCAKFGNLDYDELVQNINGLQNLMPYVFRKPISCSIRRANNGWNDEVAEITMVALNPATGTIWSQTFGILNFGGISYAGGQLSAAWFWKSKYVNKMIRIITYWLSQNDINSIKGRIQTRNAVFAEELISRTYKFESPAL